MKLLAIAVIKSLIILFLKYLPLCRFRFKTIFYRLQFIYRYIWHWIEPLAMCPYCTALVNMNRLNSNEERAGNSTKSSSHFLFIFFANNFSFAHSTSISPIKNTYCVIISVWYLRHCCWLSFNVYVLCFSFQLTNFLWFSNIEFVLFAKFGCFFFTHKSFSAKEKQHRYTLGDLPSFVWHSQIIYGLFVPSELKNLDIAIIEHLFRYLCQIERRRCDVRANAVACVLTLCITHSSLSGQTWLRSSFKLSPNWRTLI